MSSNSKHYKFCAVSLCKSTTIKTPNKLFVSVPHKREIRKKWLQIARHNYKQSSTLYFCEDHFDLEKDMLNYMEYKIMGTVKKVRIKPNSVPTKLNHKTERNNTSSNCYKEDSAENKKTDIKQEPEMPEFILGTMSENEKEIVSVKEECRLECRACLQIFNSENDLVYIFQAWVPPWEGINNTIAETMEKFAQIQLYDMDPHSKVICEGCCHKLHSAFLFMGLVQQSDHILRQRCESASESSSSTNSVLDMCWPKPIQVDKIVPVEGPTEIKQEVLTDEETEFSGVNDMQTHVPDMEIKIEPEEILMHQQSKVLNGHYGGPGSGGTTPDLPLMNGDNSFHNNYSMDYDVTIKEEPISDNESVGTDLSLDCMLCTKKFNSVTGLKAHVIAQHSYKTVKRKGAHEVSPTKKPINNYVCATCKRSFATSTDLMVHEMCHKKSVCYSCNEKFDSFELVMQHQLTCKAHSNKEQLPVKTLDDVQRPHRAAADLPNLKCLYCEKTFSDDYYMQIHLEVHHAHLQPSSDDDMEVEALESMFCERA